jgi:ADP-ribose pyrophosphatase
VNQSRGSVARPTSRQRRPATAKCVHKGVLFDVWQWQQARFDGSTATFETLRRPDTVLVLPVTTDGFVIMAEETQPGMSTVLQAIGGRIEENELPEDAALRELREEAGCEAKELRLWDAWQPVSKIDWAVYLFVAHGITKGTRRQLDPGERITLREVPATDLINPDSTLEIDDYELLHKLYFARSDAQERERVRGLLDSSAEQAPSVLRER